MFDRFTDHARKAMFAARRCALELGRDCIDTEHILLGLVDVAEGTAARWLARRGIEPARIQREVREALTPRPALQDMGALPFKPRSKRVLELAMAEAARLGDREIGTEHLLLGLFGQGDGVAAEVLRRVGLSVEAVRDEIGLRVSVAEVAAVAGEEPGAPPAPRAPAQALPVPLGQVGRWLSHWSFWPGYVGAVVLLVLVLRPWEKWLGASVRGMEGIEVHERFDDDEYTAVGTVVMAWASAGQPGPHWVLCDGQELPRAEYPELFARVSSEFDANVTAFHIPDCRGLGTWRDTHWTRGMRLSNNLRIVVGGTRTEMDRDELVQFWIKTK